MTQLRALKPHHQGPFASASQGSFWTGHAQTSFSHPKRKLELLVSPGMCPRENSRWRSDNHAKVPAAVYYGELNCEACPVPHNHAGSGCHARVSPEPVSVLFGMKACVLVPKFVHINPNPILHAHTYLIINRRASSLARVHSCAVPSFWHPAIRFECSGYKSYW